MRRVKPNRHYRKRVADFLHSERTRKRRCSFGFERLEKRDLLATWGYDFKWTALEDTYGDGITPDDVLAPDIEWEIGTHLRVNTSEFSWQIPDQRFVNPATYSVVGYYDPKNLYFYDIEGFSVRPNLPATGNWGTTDYDWQYFGFDDDFIGPDLDALRPVVPVVDSPDGELVVNDGIIHYTESYFNAPEISGQVFVDENMNGVRDANEMSGLPGLTVFQDLDGDGISGFLDPFDVTDENGFYSLELESDPDGSQVVVDINDVEDQQAYVLTIAPGGFVPRSSKDLPNRDFGIYDDRIMVSDLPDGKVLIEIQSFPTSGKGINQRFVAQVRRDTNLFGSLAQLDVSVISINAKGGNDTVTTHTTVPLLAWGGEGNDLLESTLGDSTFFGDNGNDTLLGSPQNDVLHGDAGDDTIIGNGGSDILYGDEGHNRLEGGSGHDTLNARGGYGDVLVGGDNDDTLIGSLYADELYGGDGGDTLEGRDGNDLLSGDAGEDTLDGGEGNDQLLGGSENDTLYGGAGNDELFGDDGMDWLLGGIGNDILDGGADAYRDKLVGGTGVDYFFGNYATVREKTSTLLGSKSERTFYEIKENLVDPLPGDVWQYAIMDKVTSGSGAGTFVYMESPWDYLKQARVKIQG